MIFKSWFLCKSLYTIKCSSLLVNIDYKIGTDDIVPNIRLKAVSMMPDLKAVLQMSEDPSLLGKLKETLHRIKNSETDRDVQSAIESVIPEMAEQRKVRKSSLERINKFFISFFNKSCSDAQYSIMILIYHR
jgi:hypothetical protein